MNHKILTASLVFAFLPVLACGDDETIDQEPLPADPTFLPTATILDFPVTAANTTGTQTVGITNGGQADLSLSDVSFSGPDAGLFSLISVSPEDQVIPSRESAQIVIGFTPTARGVFQASIDISSNASNIPEASLSLVGPSVLTKTGPALPDIEPIDAVVSPLETNPDFCDASGIACASLAYYNLGRDSLVITGYEIENTEAYDFLPLDDSAPTLDARPPIPGMSCAQNGESDCDGVEGDPSDDRELFCFGNGTAETEDDVCAISVPGESFIVFFLEAKGSGNTTFTINSNDGDEPAITIDLQN